MKRHTVIAQVLLIAISLGGVTYVGDSVIQARLLTGTFDVRVQLASAGGLHDRSTVTYRGNRVGIVTKVRLTPSGVEAQLALDRGTHIPADTEAVVTNLSPIGEQYLDFRPRADGAPFLTSDSVIAVGDTRTPLRFGKLLSDAGSVAKTVDPDSVAILTHELSAAFDPEEVDLVAISRQVGSALRLLESIQPALLRILRNGHVTLDTVSDTSEDLTSFSRDVDLLTAQLKESDPTIRQLLTSANTAVPRFDGLLQDSAPDLHHVLSDALTVSTLASDRRQDLDHWLKWAPFQIIDMAESTRDGSGHTSLVPNTSPTCTYGGKQTQPTDTTQRPARLGAKCTTVDPLVQQRGAQHVPRVK